MKKLFKILIIALVTLSSYEITYSQDNTSGINFYFVLHPGQVSPEDTVAEVSIFSTIDTEVLVEKGGQIIRENIRTSKNDFVTFSLTAEEAQAFTSYNQQPKEVSIDKCAIKITVVGDGSATCFVRTKYGNMSDGTALIDVSRTSNNYTISNPVNFNFEENTPANYTSIVGLYEQTRVTFRLGGCESCMVMREDGTLLEKNQTIRRTLNEGDVWFVPAYGEQSVLTGSSVMASKPVMIFSGSNMATGKDDGHNYTITQELPEDTWGMSYMIPQLFGGPHDPSITVFAKKTNTLIFLNDEYKTRIQTPGGIIDIGYYQGVAKDSVNPKNKTVEIMSDYPTNVILTDPNITYNEKQVLPFQMQILPTEQFSNIAVVRINDIETDFVNIIYLATSDGTIPDDLEISEVINASFSWENLSTYSPDTGLRFVNTLDGGNHYRTKNIKFDKAGTYHFKSDQPFGAYQYGYSETGAYGFPVNSNIYSNEVIDTLPPYVEFTQCCKCDVTGLVIDEPRIDPENRSNLAMIYMDADISFNSKFTYNEFIAGQDAKTGWELEPADGRFDSQAYLVFIDKAGNRKDTILKCYAMSPRFDKVTNKPDTFNINMGAVNKKITAEISRYSMMNLSNNLELYLILDSDSTEQKEGDINTYQNFEIVGLRDVNLYPLLNNNQTINAEITFNSAQLGNYKDSLGFVIIQKEPFYLIHKEYVEELSVLIGDNYITAEDYEFDTTSITFSKETKLKISNPNGGNSETSLDLKIHNINLVGQNIGFNGSGKSFEVSLPQDITAENPLIIKPNEFYEYDVKFAPLEVVDYNVAIVFEADADKPKNTSIIKGSGLSTSVSEEQKLSSNIEIHSENGTLKFFSQENYSLDEIEIYDLSGKLLSKFKVEKDLNGYSVETSIITNGVYIVNCRVNGLWISKKVIN